MRETSMGGTLENFPDTAGSILLATGLSADERRARVERLCSRYWRPVYAVIRAAHGRSIEDSKELTQEFFLYLLEGDVVAAYAPGRGRFRAFLKGTLRNFLLNVHREGAAQKRGGGILPASLDTDEFDTDEFLRQARAVDPDRLFDRQWAEEIVARGVALLREDLAAGGKECYFKVYEAQDLCPADRERPSYLETARGLGISENDVRNFLRHARARFEQLIVQTVGEYAGSREELKSELRDLFRS